MSQKPHIIIVPGAWHLASAYEPLRLALQQHGFQVQVLTNPSTGHADNTADVTVDERAARKTILATIAAGHDLVVISHSYGGQVASYASAGLTKTDRKSRGEPGGIVGFIGLASVILKGSPGEISGGKLAEFIAPDTPSKGFCFPKTPIETFYLDVEPEQTKQLVDRLQPQSTLSLLSTSETAPVWDENGLHGRLAYIRCLQDQAILIQVQDFFLGKTGRQWITRDLDTSHSPFASKPAETAQVCIDLMAEFAKVQ